MRVDRDRGDGPARRGVSRLTVRRFPVITAFAPVVVLRRAAGAR